MREHFKGNVKEQSTHARSLSLCIFLNYCVTRSFPSCRRFRMDWQKFFVIVFYFCSHLKVLGAFDHMILQDHGTN